MDYCKTCIYYPPSSCDGKPCTQCDPESLLNNCYVNKEDYITKKRMDERLAMMHKLYSDSEVRHIFSPSKPITNADRIRAMTDEELAKLLDNARVSCGGVMGGRNCMADCRKCWLDWLREEVE